MSADQRMVSLHTLNSPSNLVELSKKACTQAGFSPDWSETETSSELQSYKTSYGNRVINITFDPTDETNPHLALIVNFREHLTPARWKKDEQYEEFFNSSIELLCRLFNDSNAEYVGLFTNSEYDTIVPSDLPLADHIDEIPRIGIYSESLLQDFGGLAGLFEEPRWEVPGPPWRVGELDDGSLLVITHATPWADGGWTESSYLDLRPGEKYV